MRRRTTAATLLFALTMVIAALACNLTGPSGPPTIAPRATATPPPTIPIATLAPEELPTMAVTAVAVVGPGVVSLTSQIDADRLMFHVDTLQNFRTRHVNSRYDSPTEGIGAAYNYIVGQFEAIRAQSQGRLTVFPQPFQVDFAGVSSEAKNVVAFLSGTETGAGTIVIGAHYDSISIDFENGNGSAPGANDNATGVAALLELARVLSQRPHRASIIFAAFSAEEIGRNGSIAFVNGYLLPRQIGINAMLNMDIIGSQTGPGGSIDDRNIRLFSAGPADSPSRRLARAVELIVLKHAPNMRIVVQDAFDRDGRFGDHMSFSDAGYPAVRFIESLEDVSRQHNDRDTIDDVQAGYLTRVTQTVLTVATVLVDGLQPPINIALRDAGNGLRTLVWEPIPNASGYVVALRGATDLTYQRFEVNNPLATSVTWDGFVPERFAALAIAALDNEGLMGPLSPEYIIR